jgi:hypothetical protein
MTLAGGLAQGAAAKNKTECNGTFSNMTFHGGVVVNAGDDCTLMNVRVTGGLRVTGGTFNVQNSQINGGWRITGGDTTSDLCGNNVNGGLRVTGTNQGGTYDFGEANDVPFCTGGTINGGVRFVNNNALFLELDGYLVHGRVVITGNTGGALYELESTTVHGSALCANNNPDVMNDVDVGSAPGPNSFTGHNNGCPS